MELFGGVNNILTGGFYIYRNEIHFNKKSLAETAIQHKDRNPKVRYYFNDNIYNNFDWSIEPKESLQTIYLQRAKQLREKYDYIILWYSGGTDSHQILDVFLKHNIFIDEIQSVSFEKLINNIDHSIIKQDDNLLELLEYPYNIKHQLEYANKVSPKTKITVIDGSDYVYSDISDGVFESFDMNTFDTIRTLTTPNFRNVKTYKKSMMKYNQLHTRKDKTCIITGTEKPPLRIDNGDILFNFYDLAFLDFKILNQNWVDPWFALEWFFWTPDMPEIPIKQSHVIKRALETDYTLYHQFINLPLRKIERNLAKHIYNYEKPIMYLPDKLDLTKMGSEVEFIVNFIIPEKNKYVNQAVNVIANYNLKRYGQMSSVFRPIASKDYVIGKLNPKWRNL